MVEPAEGGGDHLSRVALAQARDRMSHQHPDPALPTSGTRQAYFENESASAPADVAREAAGLAAWLARLQGRTDEAALQELIAPFIADDTPEQDDDDDFDDLDDADISVEAKVAGFLWSVGLPVPAGWPRA